jgi:hypothetical protein
MTKSLPRRYVNYVRPRESRTSANSRERRTLVFGWGEVRPRTRRTRRGLMGGRRMGWNSKAGSQLRANPQVMLDKSRCPGKSKGGS